MGGVIVDLDIDRCIRSFKEKAGCERVTDYLDPFHQKGFIGDMEAGAITEEEFYVRCLRHCRPGTTEEIVAECFEDFLIGLNEEVCRAIRALHGRYDLFVLSNNNPIAVRVFRSLKDENGTPVADYFKKCFFSYEMKMLKPSREFYLKSIEGTGYRADELIFIDDSEKNTAAAEEVGIRSILYRKGTLEGELRSLGL